MRVATRGSFIAIFVYNYGRGTISVIEEGLPIGYDREFFISLGAPLISHLLYADDLLIFTSGEKKSLRVLLDTLKKYEIWSRQKINNEKLALFF